MVIETSRLPFPDARQREDRLKIDQPWVAHELGLPQGGSATLGEGGGNAHLSEGQ
jgi:hypothetical protein